jgi:hypothetical protein
MPGRILRKRNLVSLSHLNLQDYSPRKPLICLTAFLAKANSSSVGAADVGSADETTVRLQKLMSAS